MQPIVQHAIQKPALLKKDKGQSRDTTRAKKGPERNGDGERSLKPLQYAEDPLTNDNLNPISGVIKVHLMQLQLESLQGRMERRGDNITKNINQKSLLVDVNKKKMWINNTPNVYCKTKNDPYNI